jgi:hypothetical protein
VSSMVCTNSEQCVTRLHCRVYVTGSRLKGRKGICEYGIMLNGGARDASLTRNNPNHTIPEFRPGLRSQNILASLVAA